ncbi:MAG: asparagine synthase, partial [Pedobacter sp.]
MYTDTFYKEIKRLKPAHLVVFDRKQAKVSAEQCYWELKAIDITAFKSEDDLYSELRTRFTEAVRCRSRTIKNVGCQLSGGLDSSAIAVLLSRNFDT